MTLLLSFAFLSLSGLWDGTIKYDDYKIPFPIEFSQKGPDVTASFFNGDENALRANAIPEPVLPKGMSAEQVVAVIGPQIAAMDKVIAQCEERYGSRIKVLDHPILGPLTARQWRKFHLAHGRHHVKQISKMKTAES